MKAIFAGCIAALLVSFSVFSISAEPAARPAEASDAAPAASAKADKASSPRRRVNRNADARKCLELQDNHQINRCARPYL